MGNVGVEIAKKEKKRLSSLVETQRSGNGFLSVETVKKGGDSREPPDIFSLFSFNVILFILPVGFKVFELIASDLHKFIYGCGCPCVHVYLKAALSF